MTAPARRPTPSGHPAWPYALAMAAGQDAANRRMRSQGRKRWNAADACLAVTVFERLYPLAVQLREATKP